jgi:hypothetical protein
MRSTIVAVIAIGTTALAAAKSSTTSGDAPVSPAAQTHVSDDVAAIRALEDNFAAALNAGDVDAMMKNYVSDNSLIVFDVVPPRQHVGPASIARLGRATSRTSRERRSFPLRISSSPSMATSDSVTAFNTPLAPTRGVSRWIARCV